MPNDARSSSLRNFTRPLAFAITVAAAGAMFLACSSSDSSSPSESSDASADAPPKCVPTVLSGDTYDPGTATCPVGCDLNYSTRDNLYRVCTAHCTDDPECGAGFFCRPSGGADKTKQCVLGCNPSTVCPAPTTCPTSGDYPRKCQ